MKDHNMSLIKAWIISFIRLGYGLMPLGDGAWLKQPVSAEQGKLIVSYSNWWPIAQLYLIPSAIQSEFFRRMRKMSLARSILKMLAATIAMLPLLTGVTSSSSTSVLTMVIFIACIPLGILVPMIIFRIRMGRFVRSQMTKVQPVGHVAGAFWKFNFVVIVFAFIYGFLKEYTDILPSRQTNESAKVVSTSISDLAEDMILESLGHLHNLTWALVISLLKALFGLVILLLSGIVSLFIGDLFIGVHQPAPFLLIMVLFVICSFSWSYWYFIRSERR